MGRSAGPAVLLKLRAIYILEHKWEAGARSRRKGSPLRFGRVPGKHQGCACPTVMGAQHSLTSLPQSGPLPHATLPGCGDGVEVEGARQPADPHMAGIRTEPRGAS